MEWRRPPTRRAYNERCGRQGGVPQRRGCAGRPGGGAGCGVAQMWPALGLAQWAAPCSKCQVSSAQATPSVRVRQDVVVVQERSETTTHTNCGRTASIKLQKHGARRAQRLPKLDLGRRAPAGPARCAIAGRSARVFTLTPARAGRTVMRSGRCTHSLWLPRLASTQKRRRQGRQKPSNASSSGRLTSGAPTDNGFRGATSAVVDIYGGEQVPAAWLRRSAHGLYRYSLLLLHAQ